MPTWGKGLDIAFSRVSRPWCRDRYQEGYRVAVQNLWTGGFGNNHRLRDVAERNLADFANEGFLIAAYGNANPWYPIPRCIEEMKLNAGEMWPHLPVLAVDVEIDGITEANVLDMCNAVAEEGKKDPIYSAAWFWRDYLDNAQWPWLKAKRIWEAFYDGDPDVDFANRRFGPWELADVVGEQYQGTTIIDGIDVDLNVFDLDYWKGEGSDMPVDEAQVRAIVEQVLVEHLPLAVQFDGDPNVYFFGGLTRVDSPDYLAGVKVITLPADAKAQLLPKHFPDGGRVAP